MPTIDDSMPELPRKDSLESLPFKVKVKSELKSMMATSEFWVYITCVAAVLVTSELVRTGEDGVDYFPIDLAWLFVVSLTVGYMLSQGLAKMGSHGRGELP